MQWRLVFPNESEYWDEDELKEIIMGRIDIQNKNVVEDQRASPETEN